MNEEYRCKQTIDLEELVVMQTEKKETMYRVTAIYKSGRKETYSGKLKNDGNIDKKGCKHISDLRKFPTVQDVKVERF